MLLLRRYFFISDILLVTAIIFFSVKIFYKLATFTLDPIYIFNEPSKGLDDFKDESFQPSSNYKIIVDRNLFKTKTKEDENRAKQVNVETLKQTDLKLKLWGTVTGTSSTIPYAIIEDAKDNQQNLYRVGDNIQNASVKLILRKKVVLNVDGKDEVLEMEEENKLDSDTKKIMVPENIGNKRNIGDASSSNKEENTINRAQLTEALKDSNLMQQVRILPHYINGKSDGLILNNISQKSIFKQIGLMNRDIITGINGKQVNSLEEAAKLYENIATAPNLSIQVKRMGQLKNLDLKIE